MSRVCVYGYGYDTDGMDDGWMDDDDDDDGVERNGVGVWSFRLLAGWPGAVGFCVGCPLRCVTLRHVACVPSRMGDASEDFDVGRNGMCMRCVAWVRGNAFALCEACGAVRCGVLRCVRV